MDTCGFKKGLWCAAMCLIFMAAMTSYGDVSKSQPGGSGINGRTGVLQSAEKVIGMSVNNMQGDKIGMIKDLVVDKNKSIVSYVIVLNNSKFYPIPWTAFGSGEKTYTLDIAKDGLREAPTIKFDDPGLINSDITQKVRSFYFKQISANKQYGSMTEVRSNFVIAMSDLGYSDLGYNGASPSGVIVQGPPSERMAINTWGSSPLISCRDLIGIEVRNSEDKKIGEISDVIYDVRNGDIVYSLTSYGGFLGFDKKTAAVPWDVMRLEPVQKIARLDADEKTLALAQIEKGNLAKLTDPDFDRQVNQAFGREYGIYAYVPPKAEATEAFTTGAWAADSEYNRSFRIETVKTVEGAVTNVSTFMPKAGAPSGVMIKIKTDYNTTENIQLGPKSWMDKNMKFSVGDQVRVTGSEVWQGLLASTVYKDEKILILRDENGRPLWTPSQMNTGIPESNKPEPNK